MEDTKLLVAGAASSQEKLAQAAHSSAKTITQLTEVVKLGATSMGSDDPETQVRKIQHTLSLAQLLVMKMHHRLIFCYSSATVNALYLSEHPVTYSL